MTTATARTTATRRTLLRFQAVLLAASVVALGGCLAVSSGVGRTADAAADRSIPATLAAYDAQVAMRTAHRQAVENLTSVTTLRDPGSEYRYQITLAGQYLAAVAENNAAGAVGSGDIQVIQALLSTYVGLIGVAATNFASSSGSVPAAASGAPGATSGPAAGDAATLGLATLLDATQLLDNILSRLDQLRDREDDALQAQATSGWGHPAATGVWLFPVVALITLLVLAQVTLRRRFRRRYCVPLMVATLLAAVLGIATGWSTRAAGDLDDGWDRAAALVDQRGAQLTALRNGDGALLRTAVESGCATGCARTIDRLRSGYGDASEVDGGAAALASGQLRATADEAAADAAASDKVNVLLPVATLIIIALVLAGFRPRLDEYRWRPT